MNEQRFRELAGSYLGGFSESLDAMLSLVLRSEINAVEECGPEMLPVWMGTYPVYAVVGAGRGTGMALLVETATAARLLAILEGADAARDELSDEDRETLTGLMGDAARRGMEQVLDDFGQQGVAAGEAEVSDRGEAAATSLSTLIGTRFVAAQVTLTSDPDLAFDAMVLMSEAMEAWEPAPHTIPTGGSVLSPDEMNDILRGFSTDMEPAPATHVREEVVVPGNLEMVLDIKLRATARLGSVEMPLGDVLSFGPGSIIEVGRLVDEPVDLLVNNKLIARGDVVVVDEKYGLRITEIISPRERIESLR